MCTTWCTARTSQRTFEFREELESTQSLSVGLGSCSVGLPSFEVACFKECSMEALVGKLHASELSACFSASSVR